MPPPPESIDAYIATFPPEVQARLQQVREVVQAVAPQATERTSYGMPAFFLNGALVYFAAFKAHIGLYPPVQALALQATLAPYAGPKGNLRFPLDAPLPLALIRRVVQARMRESRAAAPSAAPAGRGRRTKAAPAPAQR